mmetsp:Transcript_8491/g.17450  ORF Transcript_8491/g.17450 Transcript_8491/m.17450 type:complete len:816 (+) Transcript_8491:28-2475(+)
MEQPSRDTSSRRSSPPPARLGIPPTTYDTSPSGGGPSAPHSLPAMHAARPSAPPSGQMSPTAGRRGIGGDGREARLAQRVFLEGAAAVKRNPFLLADAGRRRGGRKPSPRPPSPASSEGPPPAIERRRGRTLRRPSPRPAETEASMEMPTAVAGGGAKEEQRRKAEALIEEERRAAQAEAERQEAKVRIAEAEADAQRNADAQQWAEAEAARLQEQEEAAEHARRDLELERRQVDMEEARIKKWAKLEEEKRRKTREAAAAARHLREEEMERRRRWEEEERLSKLEALRNLEQAAALEKERKAEREHARREERERQADLREVEEKIAQLKAEKEQADELFGQMSLQAEIMDQEDPTLQGRAPPPLPKTVGSKQEKHDKRDRAEGLRLHREGNAHMSKKEFQEAIDKYSGALWICPNEADVSCQFYLSRASAFLALSEHREAAKDGERAVKLNRANPACHTSLGRALYHLGDYEGTVAAFEEAKRLNGWQVPLNQFDVAYLAKATAALTMEVSSSMERSADLQDFANEAIEIYADGRIVHRSPSPPPLGIRGAVCGAVSNATTNLADLMSPVLHRTVASVAPPVPALTQSPPGVTANASVASVERSTGTIPKLRPPRFVPRNESKSSIPLGTTPRNWPSQSKRLAPLRIGPEHAVKFGAGPLGIKLNRGGDGYIRVLSHKKNDYGPGDRPVAVGDLVREAAGVDLSRPITNKMWGETVEIIKRSRRPMFFVVAEELSPRPPGVLTTFQQEGAVFPGAAGEAAAATGGPAATGGGDSGDESSVDTTVREAIQMLNSRSGAQTVYPARWGAGPEALGT